MADTGMKSGTEKKELVRMWLPVMGLVAVIAIFGIWSGGRIFMGDNITTIINQAFTTMMVASGLAMIYAQGGMDFSPGGVIALCSLTGVAVANATGSIVLVLPMCIITLVW